MTGSNISLLVCGFLNPLVLGGTIYAFGFYGNTLKQDFSLTQADLDTISSVFFAAGLFAWLPGMIVDRYLNMRLGIIVGGFLAISNMLFYWSVLRQFVVVSSPLFLIATLSAMRFIISLTVNMIEAGTYKSILVFSTPSYRGLACGLAKGYPGLGTGAFSLIFRTLGPVMNRTTLNYPIMMVCFILVIIILPTLLDCVFFSKWWHPSMDTTRDETTPLHYTILVTGYLALALVLSGVTFDYLFFNPTYARSFFVTILFMVVWIGPIVSLIFLPRNETKSVMLLSSKKSLSSNSDDKDNEVEVEAPPATETDGLLVEEREGGKEMEPPRQFNSLQMMSTATAWYLLWMFSILIGQFMAILNNIGEMVQAQGFPTSTMTPVALAITSVSQALTRVAAGYIAGVEIKISSRHSIVLHPPLAVILSCAVAAIGHAILSVAQQDLGWFLVGSSLSAAGFGAAWPLMMLTIGDLFGVDNFGSNYMLYDGSSLSIGTVTMAKFLTQSYYQANIEGDSTTCYGQRCFQGTFQVLVWLLFSAMISGILVMYSPLYKSVYGRNRN